MSGLDFFTSTEVFRKNHPIILANNRHQAMISGVRVAYNANGYAAGTVMALNSVSNYYEAYNDAGSSGLGDARGILFHDIEVEDFNGAASTAAQLIFRGNVFYAKLTGIDANGLTDLGARVITDGYSNQIMIF
jgi:hypothetical protein